MDGKSLAKLFDCSEGSISLYVNGKACPRKEKMDRILDYIDNYFILPTAYTAYTDTAYADYIKHNEIISPFFVKEKNNTMEEKPFKSPEKEVSVEVTFNAHTIASVLESASLYGTITITDISGVYKITKLVERA